jgi:hypothetical protein
MTGYKPTKAALLLGQVVQFISALAWTWGRRERLA